MKQAAVLLAVVVILVVGALWYFGGSSKLPEGAPVVVNTEREQVPLEPSPQPVESSQEVVVDGQSVQEFEIVETIYPGKFEPSVITVKNGIPVTIYLTSTQYEHVNRVSILPYIKSSEVITPGEVTVLKFTPTKTGELKIRNIGHGFEGTIKVVK